MSQINQRITVGTAWNLLGLIMTRGSRTIILLLLARLLAPESFGLIAMTAIAFELATVFSSSGLAQAIIRSKQVSEKDLNTVFYTNLALGSLAYCLTYFGAPLLAGLYEQPELTTLIRVMGVTILINSLVIIQKAILTREMNFKAQTMAKVLGAVIAGGCALSVAFNGGGVWSLVVQMLVQSAVTAVALWMFSNWRPQLLFSMASLNRLFAFGRNLLTEGILQVAYRNSYILVIGRFFGAELTGLYFFAGKISNLASQQLTTAIQSTSFPALSTLQDNDQELKKTYRRIMQVMIFIMAPIMALIAGMAHPILSVLFGKNWTPASQFLQLLSIAGIMYPLNALNLNLLNVKGRSDLVLKLGLLKKAVNIGLLVAAIPYGVTAIVASQVLGSCLSIFPNIYFTRRLIGYSFLDQIKDVFKPILAAATCGLSIWFIQKSHHEISFLGLFTLLALGAGIYAVTCALLKFEVMQSLARHLMLTIKHH